jgi:hypothetical protein
MALNFTSITAVGSEYGWGAIDGQSSKPSRRQQDGTCDARGERLPTDFRSPTSVPVYGTVALTGALGPLSPRAELREAIVIFTGPGAFPLIFGDDSFAPVTVIGGKS